MSKLALDPASGNPQIGLDQDVGGWDLGLTFQGFRHRLP